MTAIWIIGAAFLSLVLGIALGAKATRSEPPEPSTHGFETLHDTRGRFYIVPTEQVELAKMVVELANRVNKLEEEVRVELTPPFYNSQSGWRDTTYRPVNQVLSMLLDRMGLKYTVIERQEKLERKPK